MGNEAPTLIISANGRNSAWNQKFIHISFPGWIILHVLKVWCFSCDFFLRDKSWVLSALIYQMTYFFCIIIYIFYLQAYQCPLIIKKNLKDDTFFSFCQKTVFCFIQRLSLFARIYIVFF